MAVTTTNEVTLGFLDTVGDSYNVSISKVKDLTDTTGKALVNAVMDAMITNQPYLTELVSKCKAYEAVTTKTDIELD